MAYKNISACTHGAATITGVTRLQISGSRPVNPVHVDDDTFNSYASSGPATRSITITSVDHEQLQALDGAAAAAFSATLTEAHGGSALTIALTNSRPHSYRVNQAAPGEVATSSITITGRSTDGTTDPLTIS